LNYLIFPFFKRIFLINYFFFDNCQKVFEFFCIFQHPSFNNPTKNYPTKNYFSIYQIYSKGNGSHHHRNGGHHHHDRLKNGNGGAGAANSFHSSPLVSSSNTNPAMGMGMHAMHPHMFGSPMMPGAHLNPHQMGHHPAKKPNLGPGPPNLDPAVDSKHGLMQQIQQMQQHLQQHMHH
jgi:hypothetical protein